MSLLFPAYLVGLLGLALPWLLHRFSNQQAPEQPFPSQRFLESAPPPVSRTRQLKYLGLLLLRILSLLLLCFLFAQPWLERQASAGTASRHHLIAVDQSLSMRTTGRWEAAIERAGDIIAGIPPDDTVEVIGFDSGLLRTGRAAEAAGVQLQALSAREPGYTSSDYGTVMQGIDRLAGEADLPVKLWLITDVQQTALPARLNALYAPQLSELAIESVLSEPQRNVHLQASALSSDGVNVQVNAQLMVSASLPAGSDADAVQTRETVTVQLHAGDRLLAEQQATLALGELQTLVFDQLVMPAIANPVFTVSLAEPDDLAEDDRLDVVVKTANPMPVALLASDRNVSSHAAVFLATALETDELAQVAVVAGTAERVPAEMQHIFSGRLLADGIDLDVLQYVDSGANALVFSSAPAAVLPVIEPLRTPDVTGREMGLSDDAHPLELGQIDWSGTRFFDVPPLALADGDRVLLQTTDRQPILVEKSTQRGRLLVLNDRLDGQGSNLPLQPAFVTLMQSILAYFDASTALPDRISAGHRLVLPARVQVLDPEEQPLLTLDASANSGTIELDEPGLYKIVGIRGEHVLQVVLDAREATIDALSEDALQAWQKRYAEPGDSSSGDAADTDSSGATRTESGKMMDIADAARQVGWRLVLPLLLIALILETALANRRLDVRRDGT